MTERWQPRIRAQAEKRAATTDGIAAEGLQELYIQDGRGRATGVLVEYSDAVHVEFDL